MRPLLLHPLRWLRILFHTLGASLSLLLAVATTLLVGSAIALVLWVSSEGSLEQALRLASNVLPAGQTLEASGVSGSVKQGGRIDHLVFKQKQLTVEAQGVEVSWDWQALLSGELKLQNLHAQRLRLDDRNPPSKEPPAELSLPVHVDAPFAIDHVEWAGPPAVQLDKLQGHYRYDGQTHFLQDASVAMAAGTYTGQAQLQARSPMALAAEVKGTVQTPLQVRQAPLSLAADASAKGTLLGKDALIELKAALLPQGAGSSKALGAMQASLQAQIRPSDAQPIASAQAQWSALDLATLWPQAPSTRLSGEAKVLPDAGGWRADVQVQNAAPGSLDKQHLPLNTAHALVLYRNNQWQLNELKAALAGGTLQAQGAYAGTPAQWSVRGTLEGVQPEQIDSRVHVPTLAGSFSAQQAASGVVFESQLNSAIQGSGAATQSLQLQAKGSFKADTLQLDTLQLQTPQATLSGQLQINTHSYASSANLRAAAPGAEWSLDGNLAETSGQGASELRVKDAHAFVQWLASLPIVGSQLAGRDALGALEGSAKWSGGWQRQGQDMQVQGLLKSQRLELRDGPTLNGPTRATQLSDVQLDLNGTLNTFTTQLRGKAQAGSTQFDLQALSRGGQQEAGHWQAKLESLRLAASNALYATPWNMELQKPVELDWRSSALQQSLRVTEGTLRLTGPAPGTATIQWQPVQWTHQGASDTTGSTRWNSKGQLQGLPLGWLELLGQTRLANLGLRGDLLFGGQWEASGGNALQLRASLQRTSGDLELLGAEGAANLKAGLRDAHLNVAVDNDALRADLVWDSENGGKADAQFATRLQTVAGSITWGADAPLQGKVRASLPRVGAWSLIAPVGWRIQGTLDADAQLSGTRANPAWKGSLSGDAMSVRSVVDGIDLSNGVLRVLVNGQHLEIQQLTLQGAGGASGGQLQITGSADWLPGTATDSAANRLRMAMKADAQNFRVSAKPDQRLVVSGNLAMQLSNARLQVRGALKADQALFVLPDDTAPKLGSDVVVVRKVDPNKPKQPAKAPSPALAQTVVPDISVTLDLGDNFLLQGHGLSTRLTGQLTLKAEGAHATPRLTGELNTVGGTYRAYGQLLNIEEGTLRFSGAYDNPSLNILALRPTSQQVVGVQIGGTAQLPVVRLYSDPDLSDADKLSWLVLGRASANGGAEAAMLQQAALSLLAGKGKAGGTNSGLVGAFGLDEVSMGQASTTNLDGTTGTEATVKLGKRISRDFYVSYERTLSGTLGTFYMFYDLSRRLTLRGESGAQSAVDLIFTTRFD